MMTTTIRKHVCNTCQRSYAKAEHLHRHQRSHTGAKPFTCVQCNQKFTRLDSLSRHQRRQGHNDGSSMSPQLEHGQEPDSVLSHSTPLANSTQEIAEPSFDPAIPDFPAMPIPQDVSNIGGFGPNNDIIADEEGTDLMSLTWPDSEAFLQSILNINVSSWPQNYDVLPSQYILQGPHLPQNDAQSPWLADGTTEGSRNGTNAVRNISQIISNLSSDLASEAESAALSTTYLEACLHAFFEQMTLVLPVCHRPTFVFGDWTHPLLLNAIALGSLFMGQDINIAKGEVLWTLAHTAVATSWHSLIEHRGPYDRSNGVQLVMTALLGQTFAMLSGASRLRSTAQIFHSLGFYWARQCGAYASSVTTSLSETVRLHSEEEQLVAWRKWAADEVKLRALLGHYILDGQLTCFTGAPTCQRHTSNLLPFPCSDKLFTSGTLQEWRDTLQMELPARLTFRDFFVQAFEDPDMPWLRDHHISLLAIQVVLEGFQSLITDSNIVGDQAVGSPSNEAIETVLYSLEGNIIRVELIPTSDKFQVLLRWHAICIDRAIHFNHLCRDICSYLEIQQHIFTCSNIPLPTIDFSNWIRTRSARKALLHAVEIRSILSELPMQIIHAIHIPFTLFAAAIVHVAFVLGSVKTIVLPKVLDWSLLMDHSAAIDAEGGEVHKFLSGFNFTSSINTRSLLYDINKFLLLTKQLRRPWAIYGDIGTILHQMYAKCAS